MATGLPSEIVKRNPDLFIDSCRNPTPDPGRRTFQDLARNYVAMSIEYEDPAKRRLRELGWEVLSDEELLALVLAPGMNPRQARRKAHQLLEALGHARGLRLATYAGLRQAGLSHNRTVSLLAAFRLARRSNQMLLPPRHSFHSSLEIFRYFRNRVEPLSKECFWSVLLDGKNRIQRIVRISEGSLTSSLVHPREVFRPAISEGAAGVLFVHNHPSGEPEPSEEDLRVTRRLVETGKVVGIRVLDHVIIGSYRYFSFADEGML